MEKGGMAVEGRYSMKLGKLIKDFELEVLRGVEHYEDVLISLMKISPTPRR